MSNSVRIKNLQLVKDGQKSHTCFLQQAIKLIYAPWKSVGNVYFTARFTYSEIIIIWHGLAFSGKISQWSQEITVNLELRTLVRNVPSNKLSCVFLCLPGTDVFRSTLLSGVGIKGKNVHFWLWRMLLDWRLFCSVPQILRKCNKLKKKA